jgi:NADH-quinone oxidoreductase subunit M
MILSLIAILYGGLMAFAQADFKKLIAYASISLMGLLTLGIFSMNIQGIEGALLQMLNHGISISALFLAAGMLSERTNTSLIADYGGIAARVPVYATCLLIVLLSCVGLPGTNGFVGIFSVLLGAFLAGKSYAVIALLGIVLIAAALLWLYHRVAFNSVTNALTGRIADLDNRELAAMIPLVVLVFFIGLFPNVVFSVMHSSVANLVRHIHAKLQTAPAAVQIINDVVRTVQ